MKIETFKCATSMGWGVLVDGMTDTDLSYQHSERAAYLEAREAYPEEICLTTSDPGHYSSRAALRAEFDSEPLNAGVDFDNWVRNQVTP